MCYTVCLKKMCAMYLAIQLSCDVHVANTLKRTHIW